MPSEGADGVRASVDRVSPRVGVGGAIVAGVALRVDGVRASVDERAAVWSGMCAGRAVAGRDGH